MSELSPQCLHALSIIQCKFVKDPLLNQHTLTVFIIFSNVMSGFCYVIPLNTKDQNHTFQLFLYKERPKICLNRSPGHFEQGAKNDENLLDCTACYNIEF